MPLAELFTSYEEKPWYDTSAVADSRDNIQRSIALSPFVYRANKKLKQFIIFMISIERRTFQHAAIFRTKSTVDVYLVVSSKYISANLVAFHNLLQKNR